MFRLEPYPETGDMAHSQITRNGEGFDCNLIEYLSSSPDSLKRINDVEAKYETDPAEVHLKLADDGDPWANEEGEEEVHSRRTGHQSEQKGSVRVPKKECRGETQKEEMKEGEIIP